jgi:hypothetical protein
MDLQSKRIHSPCLNKKPKYQEKPQFKLQEIIEGKSKNRFMQIMNASVIEITKFIKDKL